MARTAQRAEQRANETFRVYRDTGDKFTIPPELIPDGMTYEWKRLSVLGKEDRRHQIALQRNKWAYVPADREEHEILGSDPTEPDANGKPHPYANCIIVDGLILMERPSYITDIVVQQDHREAKGQIRSQIERLRLVPEGTLGNERGERNVGVRRDRDLSIPSDAGGD